MELLEIESKRTLRREETAVFLRRLADSLERHNDVEFTLDGVQYKIRVPPEIVVEVELEVDDDTTSLEIELSW